MNTVNNSVINKLDVHLNYDHLTPNIIDIADRTAVSQETDAREWKTDIEANVE